MKEDIMDFVRRANRQEQPREPFLPVGSLLIWHIVLRNVFVGEVVQHHA